VSDVDGTPVEPTQGSDPALRPRAEARLRAHPLADDPKTLEDASVLLHELRVHQIELEMQNEELRRTQEDLEASHERYVDLYDSAAAGYLTLDKDGRILEANLPAAALLGVERDSLPGRLLSDFIAAEDQDEYHLHRRRLLKAGDRDDCELRLGKVTGDPLWLRVDAAAVPCTDGEQRYYRVALSDITVRKSAEQAEADAKDLLARVEEISHAGGWEYDVASGRGVWTDEVYRIYGLGRDFDIDDVERVIALCSAATRPTLEAAFRRAVDQGAPYDLDVEIVRPDGVRIWVNARGHAATSDDGAVIRVIGAVMDITARRVIEQALRRMQATRDTAEIIANVGSVRWDLTTQKAEWSPGMHRLFALSEEEFVGDNAVVLQERFAPEDRARVEEGMTRALQTGVISPADYRVVWPDGSEHILHGEGTTEFAPDGKPLAIVGYYQDVTEARRAAAALAHFNDVLEERVQQRTSQLESANAELEAFVYSASHDLRAPLRAIDGFSQMIVEDASDRLDEDDVEHLQRVRNAAGRMAKLIDHLLSLSRTARQDLLRTQVDLSAMAKSVLADLQEAQPGRRVTGVVAPGLVVDADAALLHVILTNLLANAWKFTSRHETARIEVGAVDTDGGLAYFVKDDGAGFDPDVATHLFGAFQRYHSADEFEGDGIGLATVQRLVARHGGRVWSEAEVEKGATFFFTLPDELVALPDELVAEVAGTTATRLRTPMTDPSPDQTVVGGGARREEPEEHK
jgi:PAS domain S-box-containing protein